MRGFVRTFMCGFFFVNIAWVLCFVDVKMNLLNAQYKSVSFVLIPRCRFGTDISGPVACACGNEKRCEWELFRVVTRPCDGSWAYYQPKRGAVGPGDFDQICLLVRMKVQGRFVDGQLHGYCKTRDIMHFEREGIFDKGVFFKKRFGDTRP